MNEVGKFVMRDLKHIDINYAWDLEKRIKELCSYIFKVYGYRIKLNDYNGEDTIEFDFVPNHIELQGRCAETHDETSVIPIICHNKIYHVSYESFLWTMLEETLDIKVDSCEPHIVMSSSSHEIITRSYIFSFYPKQEVTYEEEKGCNDYHYEKENGGC